MKILQKRVNVVYRFRCINCLTQFEMSEDEKKENDWKYGEEDAPSSNVSFNPFNKFFCPVCNSVQMMVTKSICKVNIMDNGEEYIQKGE